MRLLADENIAPLVIAALQADGHDVAAVRDFLPGGTDAMVIALARRQRRIILTHDRDFGNVTRYPIRSHGGVILIRVRDIRPPSVLRVLRRALHAVPARRFRNRLAIVNEYEVRSFS